MFYHTVKIRSLYLICVVLERYRDVTDTKTPRHQDRITTRSRNKTNEYLCASISQTATAVQCCEDAFRRKSLTVFW